MSVSIPAGNDPFIGGSKTPNAPPPALGGSIAPAQTNVGDPIQGVNAGAPFFARNNRGSNIGIPYARLCPLGGERNLMGLGRPPLPTPPQGVKDKPNASLQKVVTETDDLRATKLAFILGRRSAEKAGVGKSAELHDVNTGDPLTAFNQDGGVLEGNSLYDYGFQLAINSGYAPGVPGTERFQKLCSFEYLQRYFTNVLCNKGINLGVDFVNDARQLNPSNQNPIWQSGIMRQVNAAARARTLHNAATGPDVGDDIGAGLAGANMLVMPDLCKLMGLKDSAAAETDEIRQGIFARDHGPFLRGKGVETGMLLGTTSNAVGTSVTENGVQKVIAPYHVSRTAGDELAFALLERLMESRGLTDWRPDGIVLSLGTDDPSDTLSNEQLQARDGQLFNIRVQGPAIGSSWTGDPALETMPLDKVFVVIIADVWWGDLAGTGALETFVNKVAPLQNDGTNPQANGSSNRPQQPNLQELRDYLAARNRELDGDNLVKNDGSLAQFDQAAEASMQTKEVTRLCNFRVKLATSSQMINYSPLRFGRDGQQVLANDLGSDPQSEAPDQGHSFMRVPNQSRMGLRLGNNGGEYIVGGWCIGNVLDTSASRGVMPGTGSSIGVRTAPNSMALNINVQVDWWDPDRMWRSFMNKTAVDATTNAPKSSLAPRYVKTVPDSEITSINKPIPA